MSRNYYDPRDEDAAPEEEVDYPIYDEAPDYPPEATDDPRVEAGEGEVYAEPERSRGCSWLIVFILMVLFGVSALVIWGVRNMITSSLVQSLHENYSAISPAPAERVQLPKADMQLQIFYIARGRALAAETRRLRKPASENERLRLIAQELAKPPSGKLLASPLPAKSIRGVYLLNNIAYVDLGIEATKVDSPTPLKERLEVYALVNSLLLNNRSIQGVQLMIDGRPATTVLGWLDVSSPLGPDLSLESPGEAVEDAG